MTDTDVLKQFLETPLACSDGVFDRFAGLPGAVMRGQGLGRFLYVEGSRTNKVLLVAHADTFWHGNDNGTAHTVQFAGGILRSSDPDRGLGADDRAGCAIVWLLKDMGHSLLITDGEERGQIGSFYLMNMPVNSDIAETINRDHSFVVEFDRCNSSDFKCYDVGTEVFRRYISSTTGYTEPNRRSYTDIGILCRDVAGVNLSIGYYKEHTPQEYLVVSEWQTTLNLCRSWLACRDLPYFSLEKAEMSCC